MNTNSMDGTSIKDLQYKSSMGNNQDYRDNHEHHEHYDHDDQRDHYNPPGRHAQQHTHHEKQEKVKQNEQIDIDELARDISDNLNEKEDFDSEEKDAEKDNLTLSVPYNLKYPLLLLIIYFILSQASIRQLFGKYIPYINPDEEGVVSQLGVIIYGVILVGLFMVIKKFL